MNNLICKLLGHIIHKKNLKHYKRCPRCKTLVYGCYAKQGFVSHNIIREEQIENYVKKNYKNWSWKWTTVDQYGLPQILLVKKSEWKLLSQVDIAYCNLVDYKTQKLRKGAMDCGYKNCKHCYKKI